MEEGTETPKYDHLTVYSPLPESETLLYCGCARRYRHHRGLYSSSCRRNDRAARAGQDNPQASVLLGGSADNYIQLREAGLLETYQSQAADVPGSLSG